MKKERKKEWVNGRKAKRREEGNINRETKRNKQTDKQTTKRDR